MIFGSKARLQGNRGVRQTFSPVALPLWPHFGPLEVWQSSLGNGKRWDMFGREQGGYGPSVGLIIQRNGDGRGLLLPCPHHLHSLSVTARFTPRPVPRILKTVVGSK